MPINQIICGHARTNPENCQTDSSTGKITVWLHYESIQVAKIDWSSVFTLAHSTTPNLVSPPSHKGLVTRNRPYCLKCIIL